MPNNLIDDEELVELDLDSPIPQNNLTVLGDVNTTEGRVSRIALNIDRREAILQDLFKGGAPTDNKDRRMALEVMTATDDSLLRLEKIDKESKAKEVDDATLAKEMAAVLKESFALSREMAAQNGKVNIDIPEEVYDAEILETSLHIGKRVLDTDEYMEN